jgi:hypothetical protein
MMTQTIVDHGRRKGDFKSVSAMSLSRRKSALLIRFMDRSMKRISTIIAEVLPKLVWHLAEMRQKTGIPK